MRTALTRLAAGVFVFCLAGCPVPAPAKPKPVKPAGPAVQVLWYSWDWDNAAAFDPARIRALGGTGVLAVSRLNFGPNNRVLTLEELRADAAAIQARTGELAVWWSFGCTRQAGNPLPASPARTFVDVAQRNMLLDNYATIGRVAKERGFPCVAIDLEPWVGSSGLAYPKEPELRPFGQELVTKGLRRENPGLQVCLFGPLSAQKGRPGFQPLIRGIEDAAGSTGVFFNEDTYGLSAGIDTRKVLKQTGDYTGARQPAAGWFASTRGADVPGWFQAATLPLKAAVKVSPYVMVYREGQMTSDQQAALDRTIHALQAAD